MIYTDSQTLIQLPKPTILCHIEWQKGREKKKKKKRPECSLRVKQKIVPDGPSIKPLGNDTSEGINTWELKLRLTLWLVSSMTQQQS